MALLTTWFWTSHLNWEGINFYCFKSWVVIICYSCLREHNILKKKKNEAHCYIGILRCLLFRLVRRNHFYYACGKINAVLVRGPNNAIWTDPILPGSSLGQKFSNCGSLIFIGEILPHPHHLGIFTSHGRHIFCHQSPDIGKISLWLHWRTAIYLDPLLCLEWMNLVTGDLSPIIIQKAY